MTDASKRRLSDEAANVVENIACRIAERYGGRISVNHLMPYLPMSLELVKECLDAMADGTSVVAIQASDHVEYDFAAYKDCSPQPGIISGPICTACDKDPISPTERVLCAACANLLLKELHKLAETMGWPAQAVYEHDILYHAATLDQPIHAAELAGSSSLTLRSMRQKLDRLVVDRYAKQELDTTAGVVKYSFPAIEYPRLSYGQIMGIIRSYPASIMEEVQLKVTKILLALGMECVGAVVLAFFGIPFPLLTGLLLIAAPITALAIWRHKTDPVDD